MVRLKENRDRLKVSHLRLIALKLQKILEDLGKPQKLAMH